MINMVEINWLGTDGGGNGRSFLFFDGASNRGVNRQHRYNPVSHWEGTNVDSFNFPFDFQIYSGDTERIK